jgi:hypothetical protein
MTNKTRTKVKKMNFMNRDRRVEVLNDVTKETMVSIATKTQNEKLQATTRRSL